MQLEAFKAVFNSGNGNYSVSKKESGDDDKPTYVTLADASKYLGITQVALQKNLASKIYRNEVSNTVYADIGHPIAVSEGVFTLDGSNKKKVFVSMDYLRMRRKLREQSPRRKTVKAWEIEKAIEENDYSLVEGKFVSEYDARLKVSSDDLGLNRDQKPLTVYPDDPHSTVVVPVNAVLELLSRMPHRKQTPERYAFDLLTKGLASSRVHVFVDQLYAVGIIDEELLIKALADDRTEHMDDHLLMRPQTLAQLAGGEDALRQMIGDEFSSVNGYTPTAIKKRTDALESMRKAFGTQNEVIEAFLRSAFMIEINKEMSADPNL